MSFYDQYSSPIGVITIFTTDRGITEVVLQSELQKKKHATQLANVQKSPRHPLLAEAKRQLKEYFSQKRTAFDLPLDIQGTPFQKQTWKELQKIPYGKTISYGEQAKRLGDAKKARAVGMANGKNPVSIIIPCHRVIGKDGSLTGFGGGLKTKKFLLDLENNAPLRRTLSARTNFDRAHKLQADRRTLKMKQRR